MSETKPLLALDKIVLAYGGHVAVDGLDLAVADGEILALLGPSGCGKTTTMRAIAGLLRPRSGRVVLGDRDITHISPNQREVGMMFQSYALFPHLSVWENVAFGLRVRRVDASERARRVEQSIAQVGLAGMEQRLPRELSGGQQQRVALARAVVLRPRLLLLDEPLSNLDAPLRMQMRSELQRLQRELGITMIFVTHDQVEALALADRVVVMRAGRIAQQGRPQEIYQQPRSVFVAQFVGVENVFHVRSGALRGPAGELAHAAKLPAGAQALGWRAARVVLGQGPYEGRVAGASYLGEMMEYLLDTPAGPVKAQVLPNGPRHALGQNLWFDLPMENALLLESD